MHQLPTSHKHQHHLPKTTCATKDAYNCGRLITINLDPDNDTHEHWNKIRQKTHYGTTRWESLYGTGGALSESGFAGPRGNFTNQAQPMVTRVSGTTKRGLVKICMAVSDNIRLIASHRIKRGLEANPLIAPTNTPPTPPDADEPRQTDMAPRSGTDPPTTAHTPPSTP